MGCACRLKERRFFSKPCQKTVIYWDHCLMTSTWEIKYQRRRIAQNSMEFAIVWQPTWISVHTLYHYNVGLNYQQSIQYLEIVFYALPWTNNGFVSFVKLRWGLSPVSVQSSCVWPVHPITEVDIIAVGMVLQNVCVSLWRTLWFHADRVTAFCTVDWARC